MTQHLEQQFKKYFEFKENNPIGLSQNVAHFNFDEFRQQLVNLKETLRTKKLRLSYQPDYYNNLEFLNLEKQIDNLTEIENLVTNKYNYIIYSNSNSDLLKEISIEYIYECLVVAEHLGRKEHIKYLNTVLDEKCELKVPDFIHLKELVQKGDPESLTNFIKHGFVITDEILKNYIKANNTQLLDILLNLEPKYWLKIIDALIKLELPNIKIFEFLINKITTSNKNIKDKKIIEATNSFLESILKYKIDIEQYPKDTKNIITNYCREYKVDFNFMPTANDFKLVFFHERLNYTNIIVDQEDVIINVPISAIAPSGIATDNTCRSKNELTNFFKEGPKNTIVKEIDNFIEHLEYDINILKNLIAKFPAKIEYSDFLTQKTKKLEQLKHYKNLFIQCKNKPYIDVNEKNSFLYPTSIQKSLEKAGKPNCYAINLSPNEIDSALSVSTTNYTFSLRRKKGDNYDHSFASYLQTAVKKPSLEIQKQTYHNTLQQEYNRRYPEAEGKVRGYEDFNNLNDILNKYLLDNNVPLKRDELNIENVFKTFHENLYIDFKEGTTNFVDKELQEVRSCLLHLVDKYDKLISANVKKASIFDCSSKDDELEDFCIKVQFLLANINVYLVHCNKTDKNIGDLLDNDEAFRNRLIKVLIDGYKEGEHVDSIILNEVLKELNILLEDGEQKKIIESCIDRFETIWESPHYDEFLILLDQKSTTNLKFYECDNILAINFKDFVKLADPESYDKFYDKPVPLLPIKEPVVKDNKSIDYEVRKNHWITSQTIVIPTLEVLNDNEDIFRELNQASVQQILDQIILGHFRPFSAQKYLNLLFANKEFYGCFNKLPYFVRNELLTKYELPSGYDLYLACKENKPEAIALAKIVIDTHYMEDGETGLMYAYFYRNLELFRTIFNRSLEINPNVYKDNELFKNFVTNILSDLIKPKADDRDSLFQFLLVILKKTSYIIEQLNFKPLIEFLIKENKIHYLELLVQLNVPIAPEIFLSPKGSLNNLDPNLIKLIVSSTSISRSLLEHIEAKKDNSSLGRLNVTFAKAFKLRSNNEAYTDEFQQTLNTYFKNEIESDTLISIKKIQMYRILNARIEYKVVEDFLNCLNHKETHLAVFEELIKEQKLSTQERRELLKIAITKKFWEFAHSLLNHIPETDKDDHLNFKELVKLAIENRGVSCVTRLIKASAPLEKQDRILTYAINVVIDIERGKEMISAVILSDYFRMELLTNIDKNGKHFIDYTIENKSLWPVLFNTLHNIPAEIFTTKAGKNVINTIIQKGLGLRSIEFLNKFMGEGLPLTAEGLKAIKESDIKGNELIEEFLTYENQKKNHQLIFTRVADTILYSELKDFFPEKIQKIKLELEKEIPAIDDYILYHNAILINEETTQALLDQDVEPFADNIEFAICKKHYNFVFKAINKYPDFFAKISRDSFLDIIKKAIEINNVEFLKFAFSRFVKEIPVDIIIPLTLTAIQNNRDDLFSLVIQNEKEFFAAYKTTHINLFAEASKNNQFDYIKTLIQIGSRQDESFIPKKVQTYFNEDLNENLLIFLIKNDFFPKKEFEQKFFNRVIVHGMNKLFDQLLEIKSVELCTINLFKSVIKKQKWDVFLKLADKYEKEQGIENLSKRFDKLDLCTHEIKDIFNYLIENKVKTTETIFKKLYMLFLDKFKIFNNENKTSTFLSVAKYTENLCLTKLHVLNSAIQTKSISPELGNILLTHPNIDLTCHELKELISYIAFNVENYKCHAKTTSFDINQLLKCFIQDKNPLNSEELSKVKNEINQFMNVQQFLLGFNKRLNDFTKNYSTFSRIRKNKLSTLQEASASSLMYKPFIDKSILEDSLLETYGVKNRETVNQITAKYTNNISLESTQLTLESLYIMLKDAIDVTANDHTKMQNRLKFFGLKSLCSDSKMLNFLKHELLLLKGMLNQYINPILLKSPVADEDYLDNAQQKKRFSPLPL